jgi:hypothetical protein
MFSENRYPLFGIMLAGTPGSANSSRPGAAKQAAPGRMWMVM